MFSNCWRNGKWQEQRAGKWERSISKALRGRCRNYWSSRRAKKRGIPNWIRLLAAFTVTGEWQEQAANEAMLVWLKRFSDNADVEKARAEFERCSKGRFAGIGPRAGKGAWSVRCDGNAKTTLSIAILGCAPLVFIPMGRKKIRCLRSAPVREPVKWGDQTPGPGFGP